MNTPNIPYIAPRENNLYIPDVYNIPSHGYSSALLNGVKYGFMLFMLIIILWIAWAELVLKWSTERIGGLMLEKYKFNDSMKPHDEQITLNNYQYLDYSNLVIAGDRSFATCNIDIADSKTRKVISSVAIKYFIVPHCQTEEGNKNIINDANCIKV